MKKITDVVEANAIIPKVSNSIEFEYISKTSAKLILLEKTTITDYVDKIKELRASKRKTILNIDNIEGFTNNTYSMKFILRNCPADIILSANPDVILYAKKQGYLTMFRAVLTNDQSFENAYINANKSMADSVELIPGIAFKAITKLKKKTNKMVLASDLIWDVEDAQQVYEAGAYAIVTSNTNNW